MFQVTANPEKNRLYVTLNGHLEAEERKLAAKAFLSGVGKLQPGFDIIHDMTKLLPTDTEGLRDLMRVQAAAKIKGVRIVIRIAKIPLSSLQLERIAGETGWAFEMAETLQEAEARLDTLGPPTPSEG